MVPRPIKALHERFPGIENYKPDGYWADFYGLDSEYDYDPFWQRCVELNVAVTCHGAAAYGFPWKNRSISSWTYNHIGNQPWMQDMLCKTLYFGGVRSVPAAEFRLPRRGRRRGPACSSTTSSRTGTCARSKHSSC